MSDDKHIDEFLDALGGPKGELDGWLEVNSESEVRDAINGALARLRSELETVKKERGKWHEYHDRLADRYDEFEGENERLSSELDTIREHTARECAEICRGIALKMAADGHELSKRNIATYCATAIRKKFGVTG